MAHKTLPIYNIENFNYLGRENDFFTNILREQLDNQKLIQVPHKHDFFTAMLITKGSGTHTIDFVEYNVKPGHLYMLSPGQLHSFVLSNDTDGYLFFHSRSFFEVYSPLKKVRDYPFFCSIHNTPLIALNTESLEKAVESFTKILKEFQNNYLMKFEKIHVLVEGLYIDLSRVYLPERYLNKQNQSYLTKIRKLEDLIDANFKELKSPNEYAKLMFMSEKHLNRICKECLNKTTSDLIMCRIMLEAKRLLIHSDNSISEIAGQLGYFDKSHFSRLFKKNSGKTPLEFVKFESSPK
jgi:AraC family transcriptional activator of pobA